MRKLYLIRHGETLFNLRKKRQGWCDSPLTKNGIDSAKKAGEFFKKNGYNFDVAYSSTQERASDTLELITDLEYKRLKNLKEWNFGEFEGADDDLGIDRNRRPDQLSFEDWWVKFGGESVDDVGLRMQKAMQEMIAGQGENILAVSHGGAMWSLILRLPEVKNNLEKYGLTKGIKNLLTLEFEIADNGEYKLIRAFSPIE